MRESDIWPSLRRYWHPVAFSEDVAEKPLAVRLLDERVVVWIASFKTRRAFESAAKEVGVNPPPFETFVLEPGQRSRLYHRGG